MLLFSSGDDVGQALKERGEGVVKEGKGREK